jgi:hypothetical protein
MKGLKEGGAVNSEIGETLSSNKDGKEKALNGRFKVSMSMNITRVKGDTEQECKRGGKCA